MVRRVFTLNPADTVLVANEIMNGVHARHVPVINGTGALVGMVSHRNILEAYVEIYEQMKPSIEPKAR